MNFVLRLSWLLLLISTSCDASQIKYLHKLIESQRVRNVDLQKDHIRSDEEDAKIIHPVYIGPQEGLMEADRIDSLPMQPPVKFNQYAGYVTVDPNAGRALFYYFVESPEDSSTKPLLLWLNGGPGCSSFGYGAMEEIGPFRVNSDGKSLSANEYAWNKVANVLFLESPAGVGYSYSNLTSDYNTTGDKKTWEDSYTFLINWLDRFPQYKTRDLYIAGESYAGHYIPQLASVILAQNIVSNNRSSINLKSIAIGNAYVDSGMNDKGMYDYLWSHAMISDETHQLIVKKCDFAHPNYSDACIRYITQAYTEMGDIDIYNIYAPLCNDNEDDAKPRPSSFYLGYDPCTDNYVQSYLNLKEVQHALHAVNSAWSLCSDIIGPENWIETPRSVVPLLKNLIVANKIGIWLYSGDTDAIVPVTSSRYTISTMNLRSEASWRAWYSNNGTEVGGYVEGYKGLTLVTIRDAGHDAPSYQQERSLTMISSFLQGKLPPASS